MGISSEDLLSKLEEALIDFKLWVRCVEDGRRDMIEQLTVVLISDDDRKLILNAKHELETFLEEAKKNNSPVLATHPDCPFGEEHDAKDSRN